MDADDPELAAAPQVRERFRVALTTAMAVVVALGAVFPIYVNTFHGIRAIDPGLLELARVYQIGRFKVFTEIVLPGALPNILLGVRYALGITWLTLIVAETVAARSGIGFMAMNAREFLETDVVVLSILLYALFGKTADSIARYLERSLLGWHHSQQGVRAT